MDISIVGSPRRSRTQSADHSPEAVPDTEGNVLGPFFPSGGLFSVRFVCTLHSMLASASYSILLYAGSYTTVIIRSNSYAVHRGDVLGCTATAPAAGVLAVGVARHVGSLAEKSGRYRPYTPHRRGSASGAHAAGTRCGRTLRAHAT